MNGTPFEKFIALVEVDQQINGLNAAIAALEQKNNENNKLIESSQAALTTVKNKLHDTRKEVDAKELEMKTLDLQEADKKKRIDTVANHREYQLIKAEIDQLKKAQHELEEGLMSAWNQLETVKKESEAAQQNFEQQNKTILDQIDANNKKIAEIKVDVDRLIYDRVEKEQVVPAEWLEKYAIMRARVKDPVVPVNNDSCSACFYKISTQDMTFLKHRKLVQCKDCFRLLYLQEAHAASAPKENA